MNPFFFLKPSSQIYNVKSKIVFIKAVCVHDQVVINYKDGAKRFWLQPSYPESNQCYKVLYKST